MPKRALRRSAFFLPQMLDNEGGSVVEAHVAQCLAERYTVQKYGPVRDGVSRKRRRYGLYDDTGG